MSRTKFGLTTPPAEIAAVRSKNEFFEVPITIFTGDGVTHITAQKADNSYSGSDYGSCFDSNTFTPDLFQMMYLE